MKKPTYLLSTFFAFLGFCLAPLSALWSQDYQLVSKYSPEDPLVLADQLLGSSEILLMWDQGYSNGPHPVSYQIFDYLGQGTPLQAKPRYVETTLGNYGMRHLAAITADFDGDNYDEMVSAYTGPNRQIEVYLAHVNEGTFDLSTGARVTIDAKVKDNTTGSLGYGGQVKLAAGNFDEDSEMEFVVAYRNADTDSLYLRLFDTQNLTPVEISEIHDEPMPTIGPWIEAFDIVAVDLDLDGKSEVALASYNQVNGKLEVFVKIYTVEGNQLVARSKKVVNRQEDDDTAMMIGLTHGDFLHNTVDQLVIGFNKKGATNSGESYDDTFIYWLQNADDLTAGTEDYLELLVMDSTRLTTLEISNQLQTNSIINPMDLEAGDLNGDGDQELVIGNFDGVRVFDFDTTQRRFLKKEELFPGFKPLDAYFVNSSLEVADLDGDMIDEVIYLRDQRKVDANGNQDSLLMKVSVFQASPNLSQLNLRTEMDRFEPITTDQGRRRMHTLAVGDFDGDGLRLGPGRRFSLTDIKQPLVVLNAPPTHYDILDGTTYDINDCFGGGCNYSATYSLQSATTISASSEISRTWGVSATASAGGSYGVFEAGASITASYGEGFSQSDVESETVEISISATTNHDDMIYATVQNYTVWEYPLYEGDIIVGHVISVVPELTGQEWFPSKSYKATSFIPDHEVDNIISYREYPNDFFQDNPNVDKALKNFQTYTIDQGLSYNWSVGFNNFTENGNQSENTIGLDVSANAGVGGEGWGLSVETEANYESFEVETQTVSIDTTIQIDVVFDGIDRTIGENQYGISPFLYWSKNGALVLDYAVRPELPGGGTANNWWTLEYGQQHDPAFILPWRFDPEKGLALTDTTRRYETKSLTYWPENPKPGDKVRVTAYVHNWSLLPTNAFVDISFYIGHPLEGGQLLTDINGQTMLTTNDYIEARGRQKVEFEFYLPAGLGNFPRLYAYIDPSQQLSEIHETNNIGYVTLASFSAVSNEELQEELAQQQKWSKAYPNPFSDQFTIEYEVPGRSEISLDLLDINGRQIRQLAEAEVNPGTHKVKVLTEDLPAGMYLYRLQVGTHQEFGKLIRR